MNNLNLNNNSLPQKQKIIVVVLIVFFVLVVIFWLWQVKAQINQPFIYPQQQKTASGVSSKPLDINTVLKNRDTDGDGLSDYDEIYVYHTSPYLEDSDSDGLSDQQEVKQGTDPNCPQGKDCQAPIIQNKIATTSNKANNSKVNKDNSVNNNLDQQSLQKALSGQADASTLRKLLIANGANESDLNKISDSDLMKSYQETLIKQNQK